MDYFLFLMLIYMIFMLISLLLFDAKMLSPSFIFSSSFTFMISLAYVFKGILGFEVNEKTFTVFTIAGLLFLLTEVITKIFFQILKKSKMSSFQNEVVIDRPLYINRQMIYLMEVFLIISLITAIGVLDLNTSDGSFSARMSQYKNTLLYDASSINFRFLVSQLYKINMAIAYLLGYILIYNFTKCNIELKEMKEYIFLIVIFCIFSMISQGARQPTIEILLYLVLVYIALMIKPKDKKKIRKMFVRAIPLSVVAAVVFYYTSTLVGRRKTQRGILEYLAVYFCGGLYSFNLHVGESVRTVYWGQSSFADIYSVLIKLGIVPSNANMAYHEFELYGNTVTMFGRWYEDFGSIGVYIMVIVVSLYFSIFFYKEIIKNGQKKQNHLARIFYCKFVIALVWAGYDDRIRALLSVQTIITLLLVTLLFRSLVEHNIKFKL